MAGTDYQGIAEVIAAAGIAVPSILGAIASFINLRRGDKRDTKMAEIHELVNGQSAKINAMSEAKGFREGGDEERARPTEPR